MSAAQHDSDARSWEDLEANVPMAAEAEPRTTCVLLLDCSYSMAGEPIAQLNEGLQRLRETLMEDSLARRRVDICCVAFGTQVRTTPFMTVPEFTPGALRAGGPTPLGAAIDAGLDALEQRLAALAGAGTMRAGRPWVYLLTDGAPTDEWQSRKERLHRMLGRGELSFFAIGVDSADMGTLAVLSGRWRAPLRLRGLQFDELFEWLSDNLRAASRSAPGANTPLTPPGWAEA